MTEGYSDYVAVCSCGGTIRKVIDKLNLARCVRCHAEITHDEYVLCKDQGEIYKLMAEKRSREIKESNDASIRSIPRKTKD